MRGWRGLGPFSSSFKRRFRADWAHTGFSSLLIFLWGGIGTGVFDMTLAERFFGGGFVDTGLAVGGSDECVDWGVILAAGRAPGLGRDTCWVRASKECNDCC